MANNNKFTIKNGLTVGATDVIDSSGTWVGSPTNLRGPTGPQGPIGPIGPIGQSDLLDHRDQLGLSD